MVSIDNSEVASVQAVLNGDWVGVHGLEVAEPHRRRGPARALMAGLLEVAAEHGAATAWLAVAAGNEPAHRLYAGLGFVDHRVCRYLAHPGA